ncbi:MAG: hypothetical protein HC785_27775 [Calothrix sp. CSU_2_0]|nr:hypothetical protein [Calothrix sp. CSU_2_0]
MQHLTYATFVTNMNFYFHTKFRVFSSQRLIRSKSEIVFVGVPTQDYLRTALRCSIRTASRSRLKVLYICSLSLVG